MEDVWCGEWSSSAVIGTASLERWKNGVKVKLSKQKAFEIGTEGIIWDNLNGKGPFTNIYNVCSPSFIALKYLNL